MHFSKKLKTGVLAAILILSIIPISVFATYNEDTVLTDARIGDIVSFGHYEQDNNENNGEEEVQWIVIDKNNGKLLLLSKYILDAKPFHKTKATATWPDCSLREWMNTSFFETIFSEEECAYISTAQVDNENGTTEDLIFLLSEEEVTRYLSVSQNKCTATKYARITCGVDYDQTSYCSPWLLRTIGENGNPMTVQTNGIVQTEGTTNIYRSDRGIRPAVWISVDTDDSEETTVNETATSNGNEEPDKETTETVTDILDCETWKDIVEISLEGNYILGLKSDGTILAAGDLPEGLDISSWSNIKQIVIVCGNVAGLKNDGTVVTTLSNSRFNEVNNWTNITRLSGSLGNCILCGFYGQSGQYVEINDIYYHSAELFGDTLKDVYYGSLLTVIDNNDVALYDNDYVFWGIRVDVAAVGEDTVLHKDGTVEVLRHYCDGSENWKNIKKIYTSRTLDYYGVSIAAVDGNNTLVLNTTAKKVFGDIKESNVESVAITSSWLAILHKNGTISLFQGDDTVSFEEEYMELERFEDEQADTVGRRFRSFESNGKQMLESIELKYDGTYIKAYLHETEKTEYYEDYGQTITTRVLTLDSYDIGTYSYTKGDSYRNGTFTLSGDSEAVVYQDTDYETIYSFIKPTSVDKQ